jgi:hypothetical protein
VEAGGNSDFDHFLRNQPRCVPQAVKGGRGVDRSPLQLLFFLRLTRSASQFLTIPHTRARNGQEKSGKASRARSGQEKTMGAGRRAPAVFPFPGPSPHLPTKNTCFWPKPVWDTTELS